MQLKDNGWKLVIVFSEVGLCIRILRGLKSCFIR